MDFKNFRRDMMRALVGGGMLATAFSNVAQAPAQDMAQLPTKPPISEEFDNAAAGSRLTDYPNAIKFLETVIEKDGDRFQLRELLDRNGPNMQRKLTEATQRNKDSVSFDVDMPQKLDHRYSVENGSMNYRTTLDLKTGEISEIKVKDMSENYLKQEYRNTGKGNAAGTLTHGVTKP